MKKPTIIILHGWGISSASFTEVKKLLTEEGFLVKVPDLPGFGDVPLTKNAMTFDDYILFVEKLLDKEKIILIGHSFGGRIAIRVAIRHPKQVHELILTGASGIIHPLTAKQKVALIFAKAGKLLPVELNLFRKVLYKFLGEWDYYKSGALRETFKNIYRVSIAEDLSHITVPTLLIWGERDKVIALADAKDMEKRIPKATLIIVPGASHKLPYEMPHVFVEKILPFLR